MLEKILYFYISLNQKGHVRVLFDYFLQWPDTNFIRMRLIARSKARCVSILR
jgi:hypothetical protein